MHAGGHFQPWAKRCSRQAHLRPSASASYLPIQTMFVDPFLDTQCEVVGFSALTLSTQVGLRSSLHVALKYLFERTARSAQSNLSKAPDLLSLQALLVAWVVEVPVRVRCLGQEPLVCQSRRLPLQTLRGPTTRISANVGFLYMWWKVK